MPPKYKPRHCETCDEKFVPKYAASVCCSEKCAKIRRRELDRINRHSRKELLKRMAELEAENQSLRDELAAMLEEDSDMGGPLPQEKPKPVQGFKSGKKAETA